MKCKVCQKKVHKKEIYTEFYYCHDCSRTYGMRSNYIIDWNSLKSCWKTHKERKEKYG